MARYVDLEKVKFNGLAVFDDNLDALIPLSDVRKALQMVPTADVVEVVRCGECQYKELCIEIHEYKGKRGFCSKGERKLPKGE